MYSVSSTCDKESLIAYVAYADSEKKKQILTEIERRNPAFDFSDCTFYIINKKPSFNEDDDPHTVYVARNYDAVVQVIEKDGNFSVNFIKL